MNFVWSFKYLNYNFNYNCLWLSFFFSFLMQRRYTLDSCVFHCFFVFCFFFCCEFKAFSFNVFFFFAIITNIFKICWWCIRIELLRNCDKKCIEIHWIKCWFLKRLGVVAILIWFIERIGIWFCYFVHISNALFYAN